MPSLFLENNHLLHVQTDLHLKKVHDCFKHINNIELRSKVFRLKVFKREINRHFESHCIQLMYHDCKYIIIFIFQFCVNVI